jgi:signal transduction histidine kinase
MSVAFAPDERREIQSIVEERLRRSRSSIVDIPARRDQLREQIGTVLDDVETELGGRHADAARSAVDDPLASRGTSRIPPIESLHAAEILFEAALEVLLPSRPDQTLRITVRLHRAITERISRSATSYVNTLLQQVRSAEQAERERLARELHDRAALGVGVALQNLELFEREDTGAPHQPTQQLADARAAMHDAVNTIRTIASELHDTLGDREPSEAIASYLARFAPPGMRYAAEVLGDPRELPPALAQEIYLVVREAVHNTMLHASARSIRIRLEVTPAAVSAEVRDDGVGFDFLTATGTGLNSMRERLELLGGTLTVTSGPGQGSSVLAEVPLIGHGG